MNTLHANSIRSKQTKYISVNIRVCLIFCLLISCAACELRNKDDAVALNDSDYSLHLKSIMPVHYRRRIAHACNNNVRDRNANVEIPTPRTISPTMATTTIIPSGGKRIADDDSWKIWKPPTATEMPRKTEMIIPSIMDLEESNNSENAPMTTTYRPKTRQSTFHLWNEVKRTLDPAPAGTSPCFWAVTTCCNKRADIQLKCFEYLGCIGEFFDVDPCSDDFVKAVLNNVGGSLEN